MHGCSFCKLINRAAVHGLSGMVLAPLFLGALTVQAERIPMGGEELSFEQEFLEWGVSGGKRQSVEKKVRSASGISAKKCVELKMTERTDRIFDIQYNNRIAGRIEKDDVLLCSFFARCLESSDESALGKILVTSSIRYKERPSNLFTKTYTVGKRWKHFLIPHTAPVPGDAGCAIGFRLGGLKPQTIQIGGFEIINYKNKRMMDELPITETRYEGMEPDAPWRKAAQERIREHRMENMLVEVVDRQGRPIPGARVQMELKNHAFGFGAALSVNAMFNPKKPEESKRHQDAVEDLFNKAVFENRMKWRFYRDNDEQLEEAMAWCAARNISMRGHVMVWPAWKRLPSGMEEKWADKPDEFRRVIEEHVAKMATQYPDTFAEWDVVNELYSQHEFVDMYDKDVVADWFRIAKEANPSFKRYVNDYGILSGSDEAHQNNYHEWIGYLLEQGAPVDGIGLQGHFRAPVPPEEILRRLDRFGEYGLEMQITEFDFEETDELLQARYARDFMTAVFSHPQTTGIMTWCVGELSSSKPAAAFFTADWKKKRIALAWEHMIEKEWHTERISRTNAEGLAGVRGFLGDYEITVLFNGKTKVVKHELLKGSDKVVVKF
ncbi:endo-1,4-beta-xylanase [Pontiella sulfatireligans]|uniref:Beta-xylanase n=1 Tax=Pontiella sulfatireligans TaxID=2750658 RepID=A0A6C2UGD2_9BACT|nr:endo-1,4-beta-xylanase [Pontiella sulfatireligans]VGO19240.1 Anti-sigma-I factor RsgI6 [Pontiella sulfatireligans]